MILYKEVVQTIGFCYLCGEGLNLAHFSEHPCFANNTEGFIIKEEYLDSDAEGGNNGSVAEENEELEDDGDDAKPFESGNEDSESFKKNTWNNVQIRQLAEVYTKYVYAIHSTSSNQAKRIIWDKITAELADYGCPPDPLAVRNKLHGLKRSYCLQEKVKGRSKWPFFRIMKKVMKTEKRALRLIAGNPEDSFDDDESDEEVDSPPPEEIKNVKVKKGKSPELEPAWFTKYRRDAKKRHEEKMKLKLKLLRLLENFVDDNIPDH